MSISTSSKERSPQSERSQSKVYDAHCHYLIDNASESLEDKRSLISSLSGVSLMSVEESDWTQNDQFALTMDNVHVSYGIHPWVAHKYAGIDGWDRRLKTRLIHSPRAAVGEIGIDRKWRPPETGRVEYEAQLRVFKTQLALAGELERPVSIHCVKAQGDLQEALQTCNRLPPKIYLHAFGGAPGTAEQLIRSRRFGDRLYFGFAACVNLRSPKTRSVIDVIPRDRLVLESDRSVTAHVKRELYEMLDIYRDVKGWRCIEHAAEQTQKNAKRLFGLD